MGMRGAQPAWYTHGHTSQTNVRGSTTNVRGYPLLGEALGGCDATDVGVVVMAHAVVEEVVGAGVGGGAISAQGPGVDQSPKEGEGRSKTKHGLESVAFPDQSPGTPHTARRCM